ncbi:unnamed protein product [Phytomonas sp. EM1]|nr:unnamed protein product [Phytomonas sp. EM1]|eukprot:CCW60468.1 unnamed protein product [Phytomonas sp. isolate EM1]
MGNCISLCPDPVYNLLSSAGLIKGRGHHINEIIIKGVKYSTVSLIEEGAYAFIYEGFKNATGECVALKRYTLMEPSQEQQVIEEIFIYRSLCPHKNIVKLYDSEIIHRPRTHLPELWMCMEYCHGPSLQDYINNRIHIKQDFSLCEVYEIMNHILHAIAHLHSQSPPVSHWDIKPGNFIFSSNGVLKLCDFGSSSRSYYLPRDLNEIEISERELESKMTMLYRPPETLDLWLKLKIDTKVDIWAFGVVLYLLVFKELPFEEAPLDIIDAIPKKYKNSTKPCPEEFRPLIAVVRSKMLVKNPSDRADIFEVSDAFSKISSLDPLQRPRPGLQSAQRPRF